uniref:Putative D-lactate dehydrogenase n=1 Tax=Chlamydomonas reinhardtii TaxID=3055 RepID=UPI000719A09A|nr:Chain A, Putative D-lactate dehydrogenase [Chlamydomonas reinhardtii]4ZGS_B Chain B, Putative D-lactate dehydrogenase [Chlamydomonas reinhardtii]4ZGS_C Chain C, Putative D-lactate dehydrogenase [Chlamydomonas reinhardtii]4ZGS_D Chain D, Putative D-lactate dehydrogenase [Chlamydomonas reinhardtii]4ZGS_E Chain E, Putative D-lactate dehydrogenase [Chlamydomonas reinhardtii]4ZGS_F Chain F, Putative D-lactate dehydrogenase [Chlamydomonas reinhardtii]4ZGS_G Chain G, Putative D-lactate dehydrogen
MALNVGPGGGSPVSTVEDTGRVELTPQEAAKVATTRCICYSTTQYVKDFLAGPMQKVFTDTYFVEPPLDKDTAQLARGYDVAVLFVNDRADASVIKELAKAGVKLIALRCAGFDRVDLHACAEHGVRVVRVPTYSPESVAEHAVALIFALNRHLTDAYIRVRMGNYSLSGLVGVEMRHKVVGVVGTGAIGQQAARILKGIGCKVFAYDIKPNPAVEAMGIPYVSLDELLAMSDIVTLHCPLLPSTRQLINKESIQKMKKGVMLINVSRGGLIDSAALFDALESGQIGALGLDVYENEGGLFFVDHTKFDPSVRMQKWDRQFRTLLSYPQVLVTPHTAFLTEEALNNICTTTIQNIADYVLDRPLGNEVKAQPAPAGKTLEHHHHHH